jgi:glycosyltransferase involved in cell wall biosynthesis
MEIRKTILILYTYYLPGFKAGGPIRSIAGLVEGLKDEFDFKIICGDRDAGDREPFPGEAVGRWCQLGSAKVLRIPRGLAGATMLIRSLRQESYDVLYINGVWPRMFSMLPLFCRKAGLLPQRPIVLAPRGEFTQGAFNLKRRRKLIYLKLSVWLGLYRGMIWHASTGLEEASIRRRIGDLPQVSEASFTLGSAGARGIGTNGVIAVAKNVHLMLKQKEKKQPKRAGRLRCVFVSRISPKKNLLLALELLAGLSGEVLFNIYGPAEDAEYWDKCRKVMDALPPNVRVEYKGTVEHERVGEVFAEHDLFLFPTLAENYGHVICEALNAGCPVLVSDQTPWRNLEEKGAGWDIPLAEVDRFRAILQQCVDADGDWYAALAARTAAYGKMAANDPAILEENRRMLRYAARAWTSSR